MSGMIGTPDFHHFGELVQHKSANLCDRHFSSSLMIKAAWNRHSMENELEYKQAADCIEAQTLLLQSVVHTCEVLTRVRDFRQII